MKWRISGPARLDLQEIWLHTELSWNINQADRYIDVIAARIEWLSEYRNLWKTRDDIQTGLFSYKEGRHLILFKQEPGVLIVVRVLHDRMDVKRHI